MTFFLQVEKELRDICGDILNVLDKHLIPCSDTGESKVFYYKMKGDYHRYLAEFATANDRKEAAENALVAYKAASDIAMTELATTHPIRYYCTSLKTTYHKNFPRDQLLCNKTNILCFIFVLLHNSWSLGKFL